MIINNSKIQELKEVSEPQIPNPKNNFIFFEIGKLLIKPRKKQPNIFVKKILSICNLKKEPIKEDKETIINILVIYLIFIQKDT